MRKRLPSMSYVDEEVKKSYVVTYQELIFIFIVFSVILIVLYPKDLLKEQILSEKSNYDLSMLYLKNLIKHNPEDESLMLILAEQSLRTGKRDLSLRLLELLLESKSIENRHKSTLLSYELLKDEYYYFKDEAKQIAQKKILRKLFLNIYNDKMYKEGEIEKWYQESIFLDEKGARYYFLQQKLIQEPEDVELLETAYYLSVSLSKKQDSYKYINMLQIYDVKNAEKWYLAEYYMLLQYKQYTKVKKLLLENSKNSKNSKKWKNLLAEYYLMKKEYKNSSDIYLELSDESSDNVDKREYLFQAVQAFQSGNKLDEAARLAYENEQYYIDDIVVRKFLLKLYMATGHLDYASKLSKKILQRKGY